jgi:cell division protein FtsL
MASLATFVNRFVGASTLEATEPAVWARTEVPRLRPIANEDVYLFVKRIDNSGVVRAADPAARRVRSRSVATAFVAAMLVIAGLVPSAYNTMAGFTLETLRSQQAKLKQEQSTLDLQEAELLSPTHLEQIAKTLKMVDPSPDAIQYLDGKSKTADAQNRMPVAGDVQAR